MTKKTKNVRLIIAKFIIKHNNKYLYENVKFDMIFVLIANLMKGSNRVNIEILIGKIIDWNVTERM